MCSTRFGLVPPALLQLLLPGADAVAVAAPQAPADVEETEELLLWDEELADVDPELLPKRLLTDFSIYNAEVGACYCCCSPGPKFCYMGTQL